MNTQPQKEKPASIAASGKHADRDITSGVIPRVGGKEAAALHLRLVLLLLVRAKSKDALKASGLGLQVRDDPLNLELSLIGGELTPLGHGWLLDAQCLRDRFLRPKVGDDI